MKVETSEILAVLSASCTEYYLVVPKINMINDVLRVIKEVEEELPHFISSPWITYVVDCISGGRSFAMVDRDNNIKALLLYEQNDKAFSITQFMTVKECRNMGLGSSLLMYLKTIADTKCKNMLLYVNCNNTHAIELYEKRFLFEKLLTIPNLYEHGDAKYDGFLMTHTRY